MKDLASHKNCCVTALDRARHELDRGMKALNFQEAKKLHGKTGHPRTLTEIHRHIHRWRARLASLEEAELAKQNKTS